MNKSVEKGKDKSLEALIEKEFKEKFPINGSYLDEVTGEAYYTCTFKPEDLETAIYQIAQKYADLKRKEIIEEIKNDFWTGEFKALELGHRTAKNLQGNLIKSLK